MTQTTTGVHTLTYPDEGVTGWYALWETLQQAITNHLDNLVSTQIATITDGTNEVLTFTGVGSAVNFLDITNAATGTDPFLQAKGDDANIGLLFKAKGTGVYTFDGTEALFLPDGTQAQRPGSPSAGYTRYDTDNNMLEYYNGTGWVQLDASTGAILDSDFSTNGLMIRTGAGTYTNRDIIVGSAKLTVTNGDGVSGNPSLDLGAVALDDLSDVAVTAGAKGDVLVHNGSNFIDVTVGANDTVLTADSAEASGVKWAAAAAAGAGWTLVANKVTTSGTSVSQTTGLDTFDEIMVIFRGVSTDSTSSDYELEFSDDGGSTHENISGSVHTIKDAGNHGEFAYANTSSEIDINAVDGTATLLYGHAILRGSQVAENPSWEIVTGFSSVLFSQYRGAGIVHTTSAINALRFKIDAGSFDAGSISIWGR